MPAINKVPRSMIIRFAREVMKSCLGNRGLKVIITMLHGGELAKRTLNQRLGIVGGISILGTTGVVIPYWAKAFKVFISLLERSVIYQSKSLVVGIGCHKAVSDSRIEEVIRQVFGEHKLAFRSIRNIATIDTKRHEQGLLDFAQKHNLPIDLFSKEALKQVNYPSSPSSLVFNSVGIHAVCEPAALLSSNNGCMVVPKTKMKDITIAVARISYTEKHSGAPK